MSLTILVADDEEDYRNLIRLALKPLNSTVIEAVNGKEALEKMYQHNPDIILLDINMPAPNGFDVCRKIRTDPVYRHLPIIMLTVKKTPLSQSKGLDLGADDYILKPFQQEELRARIKSVMNRSRRQSKQEELA